MKAAHIDAALLAEEARRQAELLSALWQTGQRSAQPAVQGLQPVQPVPGEAGSRQRGEQAYRVNAKALAERTLAAVFVRVRERLGADDFARLAWTLWRRHPPLCGDLGEWGEVLPEFLAGEPGMDQELVELARMEWALHAAERAPDAQLDADSLQLLADHEPEQLRLRFMPGLRVLDPLHVLVWRENWRGSSAPLSPGGAALMLGLLGDQSLAQALQSALLAEPGFDFSAWLVEALQRGWLWRAELI